MKRRHPRHIDEVATGAMGFVDPRSYVRRDKVYRFGLDMVALRAKAFERSQGRCEMRVNGILGPRCQREVSWSLAELHHEPPLSQCGDDSLEGVLISCPACHCARHGRFYRSDKKERANGYAAS